MKNLYQVRKKEKYARSKTFYTSSAVCAFMIGKRLSEYEVKKNGKEVILLEGDILKIQNALDFA